MGRRDDDEPLLPVTVKESAENARSSDLLFKIYVIISMTILWTGYTLLVRYTRSTTAPEYLYASTTVVLLAEAVKWLITVFMIYQTNNFHIAEFRRCLSKHFFHQPLELLKMSVPSLAYALQNNLDFVALSNLDAGTYQVTTQLKVVTTALFMMAFLGRRFSGRRWLAIFLLFTGVASVQLNAVQTTVVPSGLSTTAKSTNENYVLGLVAVLFTCVTAGFAGVYFEKMLKDGSSTPFWVRNLQMYTCGMIAASIGCLGAEGRSIRELGFFYGYSAKIWAIIGFLSVGGLYISLVMKHLDNLHKSFASAVSIILVVLLSVFLFPGIHIGPFFVGGTAVVCSAIVLYNSVPE